MAQEVKQRRAGAGAASTTPTDESTAPPTSTPSSSSSSKSTKYSPKTTADIKQQQPPTLKKSRGRGCCLTFIYFIIFTLLCQLTISYIIYEDFTFGMKIPNWKKFIPRSELTFTPEELAQYDGTDPEKPIYLAILGKVYDVSAGKSYYGKGGGYSFFSGRDATRSFITGCFKTHLTHDLRGLSDQEIASLKQWTDMYENSSKYFYVGTVKNPEIDPKSPIPEPCDQ